MSEQAQMIISEYDSAWSDTDTVNFRNLYQEVADLMFPRENQINTRRTPGEDKNREIADTTGLTASIDATSGMSINIFPPGDKFYNVVMSDKKLNDIEAVKRKLGEITELSHEKRANSNFMLQANETLRSLLTFGTGNMFSEYIPGVGLNYRDYDVGQYTFMENPQSRVDTMFIEFEFTAKQAFQKWGEDAGETTVAKAKDPQTANDKFKFIWVTRPRDLTKQTGSENTAMPFESIFVNRADVQVVEESGFEEFPFQVSRWAKSSTEKWGRGIGTYALGPVQGLQTEKRDLLECANLHNNPPKEVLESFEGEVKVSPGDLNWVTEKGTIRAIEQNAMGNFAITKDVIEMDRQEVRKMFFLDAFNQLEQLRGDRRNELEIRARLAEGLRKLVIPVSRIQTEWLTGLVTRDIMLLLRNGELGELPPEMEGASFKIEYIGRLALELQSAQTTGWLRWVQEGSEIEAVSPGVLDNVNMDIGYRRRGVTLGVAVEDIATPDEVAAKREARAQQQALEAQKEMLTVAAQNYAGGTKRPEPGSASEKLMETS
jgi:hypothetical protein